MLAIEIHGISKEFRGDLGVRRVRALEGLDLEIGQGEVFGFLGPNGAGKSTTIKVLMNLIRPDRGTAMLLGRDVRDREARRTIGYLPENPYFYDYLTAEELLWFGGRASGLSAHDTRARTGTLLSRVSLDAAGKRPLRTYSKGMVQRAGLALALIHDPQVVVLDEPMSGLDPLGRKMVGDLIVELKEQGKTVFFSSHILSDIERFSDRVGIIVSGRLRVCGKLSEVVPAAMTLEERFLEVVRGAGGSES